MPKLTDKNINILRNFSTQFYGKESSMFVWCAILFLLGITAFMDSLFNYGEIFRRVNSVLFMLVSLGLLVRTTTKMRIRKFETLEEKISTLQKRVKGQNSASSRKEHPVA